MPSINKFGQVGQHGKHARKCNNINTIYKPIWSPFFMLAISPYGEELANMGAGSVGTLRGLGHKWHPRQNSGKICRPRSADF
jgi:hypothetical protein